MKSSLDLLRQYSESPRAGWDLVVISSRDQSQRCAFERQLNEMIRNDRHFTTSDFKFLVVSDEELTDQTNPTITKLGSGGSTIYIFRRLVSQFGPDFLNTKKILLIHSGGYSQRLPHYSVLGKLFSNLPIDLNIGDKYWTALDVKLALLAPMTRLMAAGVWVTASDDIVVYSYAESELNNLQTFSVDCVVCLGHPSNVDIAVTHGVYVIASHDLQTIGSRSLSLVECLKVLQKPSIDELNEFNAFVRTEDQEFCITDSSYYLGPNVITDKLLAFPVECIDTEIDCYGHFLCPLGSQPITKKLNNRWISRLSDLLMGTQMKVLVLSESKFFHLGTIREYLFEMTDFADKHLAKSLHFKTKHTTNSINGTIICSKINSDSIVDKQSVLEFCDFADTAIQTNNNILYNCQFTRTSDQSISLLQFPANHLIFGVPVIIGQEKGWTTFGCHLDSELKTGLWSQKLFPVCNTSSESLESTLTLIGNNFRPDLFADKTKLAISDIKDFKDIESILNFQNKLKS